MKRAFASKIFVLLGMVSFLLGSSAAFASPVMEKMAMPQTAEGSVHAMMSMDMDNCPGMDKADHGCCKCDMTLCAMAGGLVVLAPEFGWLQAPGAAVIYPPAPDVAMSDLTRHNLPLPPP